MKRRRGWRQHPQSRFFLGHPGEQRHAGAGQQPAEGADGKPEAGQEPADGVDGKPEAGEGPAAEAEEQGRAAEAKSADTIARTKSNMK
ncbi:hypothetical protein ABU162_01860 [Paenibacillus thiaminolyticus]|uniref:hypothetical protein n=1 Tax=Paenibacillus thiaminolyticus TaxID=49283 RepID=UPI0035A67B4D